MTSPISTCAECFEDYNSADLNDFMVCYECDYEEPEEVTT